jgi:hypothetical protein
MIEKSTGSRWMGVAMAECVISGKGRLARTAANWAPRRG